MKWLPVGAPTLVGSMPHKNREAVVNFILEKLKEVPVWPQLSAYPAERMMNQYLEGLPGYDGNGLLDLTSSAFDEAVYRFYEEYLKVLEGAETVLSSSFGMGPETARTFNVFLDVISKTGRSYEALKGQVVGPFTLLSGLKDKRGRLLLFDDRMVDLVPKFLALKALWQIEQMKPFCERIIIFFDEPALAGFGSSAFISISKDFVQRMFSGMLGLIKSSSVFVGVHVCANTDWSIFLELDDIDIINCDAYNYGDKFLLYGGDIDGFLAKGGLIAWGIVPTDDPQKVISETPESLYVKLETLLRKRYGDRLFEDVLRQSLVTPSCGCGTLEKDLAERVTAHVVECSELIRKNIGYTGK